MSARNTRRIALGGLPLLIALGACGDPGTNSSPALEAPIAPPTPTSALASQVPSAPDFLAVRPGDRLDAFLGRSFGPSHWSALLDSVQIKIDECISDRGGSPQPRPPAPKFDTLDLREIDLPLFRQQYGYGIVEERRISDEREAVPVDPSPVDYDLMVRNGQLESECAVEANTLWRDALPPQPLVMRHQELLAELAYDPGYLKVGDSWEACMQDLGFETGVVSPYFSKGIVDALLIESASSGGAVDYSALQEAELAAFKADAECLARSGAGELMLILEGDILQALRSEFPDYEPPTEDPTGMAWKR